MQVTLLKSKFEIGLNTKKGAKFMYFEAINPFFLFKLLHTPHAGTQVEIGSEISHIGEYSLLKHKTMKIIFFHSNSKLVLSFIFQFLFKL